MNRSDEVRDLLLRYLYSIHSTAKARKNVAVGIVELYAEMKNLGVRRDEVNTNLDYLIQKEWVREVVETRSFTTPRGTTQSSEKKTYKVSDAGIDLLQGASLYRREPMQGMNITNINGVTIVGSGNVVNTTMTDLSRAISDLRQSLLTSTSMADEAKLNALSDLDSIQSQLSKSTPHTGVIKQLWAGMEKLITAAEFADVVVRITGLISALA